MADRKNGLNWDKGKSPERIFGNAAERYAGALTDAVYRTAVTQAPEMQAVLQQVGTWDDRGAEGGDYIRTSAYRDAENHSAGIVMWYDLEGYRVLHPREDPDFDWSLRHLELREAYFAQEEAHYQSVRLAQIQDSPVDDRVIETFHDEARYLWDVIVGMLR